MIFDHLDNAALYTGLGDRFAKAFAYLKSFSPETPAGKYPIDGDDVFAVVQSYETAPAPSKKWEGHRLYADIQCVMSGHEIIYHNDVSKLTVKTEYNPAKEYTIYHDRDDQPLYLGAGNFAVFFPHDGHKPGCAIDAPTTVLKVVIKIRVA